MTSNQSKSDQYIVRLYRPGDEAGINRLFNKIFQKQRSHAEWLWKFYQLPSPKAPTMAVAENGGEIIGIYSALPYLLFVDGNEVWALQMVDNCIEVEHRKSGVQRQLKDLVAETSGSPFAFGFAGGRAFDVGTKALNYNDVGRFPVLILDCRSPDRDPAFAAAQAAASQVKARQIDRPDGPLNQFFESQRNQYRIMIRRSPAYLEWRYLTHPGRKFNFLVTEQDGQITGFCVINILPEGDRRLAYIYDLFSVADHITAAGLFGHAVNFCAEQKADVIYCWTLEHAQFFPIVEAFSFRPVEQEPFRVLAETYDPAFPAETLYQIKNWFLSYGDTDN